MPNSRTISRNTKLKISRKFCKITKSSIFVATLPPRYCVAPRIVFFLFGMTNLTGSARRTGCSGGGGSAGSSGAGSSGAGCCVASADPPTSSPRGCTHPDGGPGHRGGPHHEAQGQQGKKEHEVMVFYFYIQSIKWDW